MQTASFRFWTRVDDFTSYDDKCYTMNYITYNMNYELYNQ